MIAWKERLAPAWQGARLLCAVARALLRPSIRGQANIIVRRHLRSSPDAASHRRGLIHQALAFVAAKPMASLLASILFAGGVAVAAAALDNGATARLLGQAEDPSDAATALRDINTALLSAQAALIALIYPVVVALVGVLFGARATAAARLATFLRETEAVASGGSALGFCGASALAVGLAGTLPLPSAAALTSVNLIWFMANLAGIGFFLSRTLTYLRPAGRDELARGYIANVAWPEQLGDMVAHSLLQSMSVLSNPTSPHADDRSGPNVLVAAFSMQQPGSGSATVALSSRPREVLDVRASLVAPVIQEWLRRARHQAVDATAQGNPRRPSRELVLPVSIGSRVAGQLKLANWSAGVPLTRLEILLLRRAYVLGAPRHKPDVSTTNVVLQEAAGEAIAAMASGTDDDFRDRHNELLRQHAFLLRLASGPSYGESFALLQSTDWWGTLASSWAKVHRDIFLRATERLPERPEFFRKCAFTASHLAHLTADAVPAAATEPTDRLPLTLAYFLTMRTARAAGHAVGDGLARQGFTPRAADEAWCEEAWRDFVAGWEHLLDDRSVRWLEDRSESPWAEIRSHWPYAQRHLFTTASLLARAAWSGDRRAGSWSVDVLLRWYEKLRASEIWEADSYGLDVTRVSWAVLSKPDWDEVERSLPYMFEGARVSPKAAFAVATRNAWAVTVLSTCIILLGWAAQAGPGSPAAELAGRILRREFHDNAARRYDGPGPQANAAEALAALLPSIVTGHDYDSIKELISRQVHRPMVSGRMYGGESGDALTAYGEALLLVTLCARSLTALDPSSLAPREPLSTLEAAEAELRAIHWLADLGNRIDELQFEQVFPLVAGLAAFDDSHDAAANASIFKSWTAAATALVQRHLNDFRSRREAAIATAPIDPDLLLALGKSAEAAAFSRGSGASPLALFAHVGITADAPAFRAAIVLDDVPRARFTKPILDSVPLNEGLWIRAIPRAVADKVLEAVLEGMEISDASATEPGSWWEAVTIAATELGIELRDTLVLVPSWADPPWLAMWRRGRRSETVPCPFEVRAGEKRNGYVCHVGDVSVFEAPLAPGTTMVLPAAALGAVEFSHIGGDRLTSTTFTDLGNPPTRGRVEVAFGFRVTLGSRRAVRLRHRAVEEARPKQT